MKKAVNKLKDYLLRNKLSHRAFAELAGIPHLAPMVSMWARGRARPSLETAEAIEIATQGEVPSTFWLSIPRGRRMQAV